MNDFLKKNPFHAPWITLTSLGMILILSCGMGVTLSAQSDNLTNAPTGKEWVDILTAEEIVNIQLSAFQIQLTDLQNQGAQGVDLELAKARVQFYSDLKSALKGGQPVFKAFNIAYANMESAFLGDYLDVKVLNSNLLGQIGDEARSKLTT